MATQTYMTAKLNLADGTIVYPQISLDNIVKSISDPTLVTVATLDGSSKVSINNLPVTTSVTDSNSTVPTNGAVYGALNTKQNTLIEGDNIIHIVNGSTIMADITNLDVAGIDTTDNNGIHLTLTGGNTVGVAGDFATDSTAGVLAGASGGVKLVDGVVQFDVTTVPTANGSTDGAVIGAGDGLLAVNGYLSIDEATPAQIIAGAVSDKVITPASFKGAISTGKAVDVTSDPFASIGVISYTDLRGTITYTGATGTAKIGWYDNTTHAFPKFAAGLVYLLIADVKNTGSAAVTVSFGGTDVGGTAGTIAAGATKRIAFTFAASNTAYFQFTATAATSLQITNLREYEVTGCSDKSHAYIATIQDPDSNYNDFYLVDTDEVNPWVPIIDMGSSPALTIASGLAYKLVANDSNAHTLMVDTFPSSTYGRDAHLQLFVGDTGHVQVQSPLILMQALTPNAVNNCTIKFRDGEARLYVDDTAYGYTVVVNSGTDNGSLYYGLVESDSEYITFSETTDGTPVVIPGATFSRVVNLIGNGMDKTTVSSTENISVDTSTGGINMSGLTLTKNLYIATRQVFSANSVRFAITDTTVNIAFSLWNNSSKISNSVVTGSTSNDAIIYMPNGGVISDTVFKDDNAAEAYLRSYYETATLIISGCVFIGPSGSQKLIRGANATVNVSGSTFNQGRIIGTADGILAISGTNNLTAASTNGMNGKINCTDGSIAGTGTVSLTGSTNAVDLDDFTFDGITITGASYSHAAAITAGDSALSSVIVTGNTTPDVEGTLAITGSSSAVSIPVAAIEADSNSSLAITGGTYAASQDIQLNGSTISAVMAGSITFKSKLYSYGTGGDLTIADNTVIDMAGNDNTTAIQPGGSIIVGSGVKVVATDGSTVNVTAGTYTSISNQGVPASDDPIYGFHRDILLNNDTVEFVQLTDDTASGAAKYTTISAADWKNIKKDLLETRACVMYSTKAPAAGQKKNTVMFYLDNADFRYKENGQALTDDELLGKVMWNGSIRLCNFMKIFPKMWMRIDEWGDKIVFSQTTSNANSTVAFVRDTTQDNGNYKAWKHSTAGTIWTTSELPAAGDNTYSNNTGTNKRDYTVSAYRLQHFAILVHKKPVNTFYLHPWFWTSEDGQTASDQYVGMFRGVACDASGNILQPAAQTDFRNLASPAIGTGMIRSIPGGRPACNNTLNNFRLYAARAGVDITNGFFDGYKNLMMVFDTGHYNAQTWIGEGQNLMQAYYWFELRNTGRCMSFGNRTCQLNADPTLDADIAAYWNGRITSKANSGDTSLTTWQRNPANDKITNNVVSAYAWTAKISGTDTYIWTAVAEPAADVATYSDNTLSTVRTGCPVGAYINGAGSRRVSVSWRGLEDLWGGCWEFRDGIQKRQDATAVHAGGAYTESGITITNAISRYSSTDEFPAPSLTIGDLPTQRTISVLTNTTYGNTSVNLVKDWDVRSGSGTGQSLCFVNLAWPKFSGSCNLWDPVLGFTTMVAANILNSANGDYFWNDTLAGSRVVFVGGLANSGSYDGPACFYVAHGLGRADAAVGVRPAASEN